MIPFDLSRFDEVLLPDGDQKSTSQRLETLATGYLDRAGLEREAAALVLSKLYERCTHTYQNLLHIPTMTVQERYFWPS